ncbi:MAG: alpha-amylase [Lachnospiraceae bacterium]|nr:alpha-amylase [Lachnospiraceae bacterium]
MSYNTPKDLRNKVMYQIYVRNFSEKGTFNEVVLQLDRIKALGVDIIWFAPIHPIGKRHRKGTLGSPYAICDYRAVNPEYGTLDDFKNLVSEIHSRGMKCIIDVVYNHTSPDSVLSKEHPEWFYHKEDGSFGNRVGDWTDIIDLDYSNKELWTYQIDTLKMWAETVDGFRCDVAPLVPVDFWLKAREEVEKIRSGCLWLSESVDPPFILEMRERGFLAQSDSEIFRAFDISYDYDIYPFLTGFASGISSLRSYSEAINRQEYIYPDNYVKLRFLENHDQPRAGFLFPDLKVLKNATAFLYFQKGMTLIYAGQEYAVSHLPDLFNKDTVKWEPKEGYDLSSLMKTLYEIKKDPLFTDSTYSTTTHNNSIIEATHSRNGRSITGIFSFEPVKSLVPVNLPDGRYINKIDGKTVDVLHGYISTDGDPLIL